jgi:hypothetical protein
VALLGAHDGWVPTHNLTALLLLAVPGTLHSKIGLMFRLLDRWAVSLLLCRAKDAQLACCNTPLMPVLLAMAQWL